MVGALLTRGMLVGILAGLLCFGFLKIYGEPQVDRAIAFETLRDEAEKQKTAQENPAHDDMVHGDMAHEHMSHGMSMSMPKDTSDYELVSRPVQAGIGLLTGVVAYSVAIGAHFALVFALAYGRVAKLSAHATSALLAAMGFVGVYIVPSVKYPANPPSIGEPNTIGMRTAIFFAMIAISLAAIIAAAMLRNRLIRRYGAWYASLIAGGAYFLIVIIVGLALPSINEVPAEFPADVLWAFRLASVGAQLILWTTIGLVFGALAERLLPQSR